MYTIHSILFCTTNESRWLPLFHWGGWLVFSLGPCVARLIPHFGQFPRNTAHTHAQLEGETHRWGLHRERAKKKERKILPLETPAFHGAVSTNPPLLASVDIKQREGGVSGTVSPPNFTKFFPFSLFFFFFLSPPLPVE